MRDVRATTRTELDHRLDEYADVTLDVDRFSYDRMGAPLTEIASSSHVAMIPHPQEVAEVVMIAVGATAMAHRWHFLNSLDLLMKEE